MLTWIPIFPDIDKYRKVIDSFTLYDQFYFAFVFRGSANISLTQIMLRVITGKSGLRVRSVNIEHEISNLP